MQAVRRGGDGAIRTQCRGVARPWVNLRPSTTLRCSRPGLLCMVCTVASELASWTAALHTRMPHTCNHVSCGGGEEARKHEMALNVCACHAAADLLLMLLCSRSPLRPVASEPASWTAVLYTRVPHTCNQSSRGEGGTKARKCVGCMRLSCCCRPLAHPALLRVTFAAVTTALLGAAIISYWHIYTRAKNPPNSLQGGVFCTPRVVL